MAPAASAPVVPLVVVSPVVAAPASPVVPVPAEVSAAEAADMRHSQVRSLDRSERIRTYNFPENRIVDHRTNYKAYNLDAVLDGDLQAVIDSDIQADEADRLANQK